MTADLLKLFVPGTIAFLVGILLTPLVSGYLYKHEMWKKKAGKIAPDGRATPIFNALHKDREVNTPRMGGMVIWASVLITILGFWVFAHINPNGFSRKFNFLTRSQTFIPLATLLIGALVGLYDDYLEIASSKKFATEGYKNGGLSFKKRIAIVGIIGLFCGFWFYFKLGVSAIGLPLGYSIPLGGFFPVFFMIIMMAVYSGTVIDGIDGLAGGIFAAMFSAYGAIAFFEHLYDLSAFCSVVIGAILAFLWFNVPPARFYMSETGSMALTMCLALVAFLTDHLSGGYSIIVLPVIGLPLVLTTGSVIIQLLSKKFRGGKKVFLVAPLHHHFEAKGWSPAKVTMRYWILSFVLAAVGVILALAWL